jgi:hypothetical protein
LPSSVPKQKDVFVLKSHRAFASVARVVLCVQQQAAFGWLHFQRGCAASFNASMKTSGVGTRSLFGSTTLHHVPLQGQTITPDFQLF